MNKDKLISLVMMMLLFIVGCSSNNTEQNSNGAQGNSDKPLKIGLSRIDDSFLFYVEEQE